MAGRIQQQHVQKWWQGLSGLKLRNPPKRTRVTPRDDQKIHWSQKAGLILFGLLFLSACTTTSPAPIEAREPGIQLIRSDYYQLPGWSDDQQNQALPALRNSCLKRLSVGHSKNKSLNHQIDAAWLQSCHAIVGISEFASAETVRKTIQANFVPYLVEDDGSPWGLFTGYYEPAMKGSLTKTDFYSVPVYAKPTSLKQVVGPDGAKYYRWKVGQSYEKMPARAEIEQSVALKGVTVLAWVHSLVDRYFLQVQGSGVVNLSNGGQLHLGYAAQNGHRYFPIGRYIALTYSIPTHHISMQFIRDWLEKQKQKTIRAILAQDPSFVFFRVRDPGSPVGSAQVPLSSWRSLAVDRHFIQMGTPIWLDTHRPPGDQSGDSQDGRFQRLMVAQDTGGAIKGPIRGDIFCGQGEAAEYFAGHMRSKGRYWVLLPSTLPENLYFH